MLLFIKKLLIQLGDPQELSSLVAMFQKDNTRLCEESIICTQCALLLSPEPTKVLIQHCCHLNSYVLSHRLGTVTFLFVLGLY